MSIKETLLQIFRNLPVTMDITPEGEAVADSIEIEVIIDVLNGKITDPEVLSSVIPYFENEECVLHVRFDSPNTFDLAYYSEADRFIEFGEHQYVSKFLYENVVGDFSREFAWVEDLASRHQPKINDAHLAQLAVIEQNIETYFASLPPVLYRKPIKGKYNTFQCGLKKKKGWADGYPRIDVSFEHDMFMLTAKYVFVDDVLEEEYAFLDVYDNNPMDGLSKEIVHECFFRTFGIVL